MPADAFAAGGFDVEASGRGKVDAIRDALERSGARVACILADADGAEEATAAALGLRSAGARFLVAADGFSAGTPVGPFDAVLTPDTDVVALLSDILDRIAEPEENGQS
jgi:methylmalonyl-CoA mutase cobalamin-binding subunit